jgi:hypothetical protein
VNSIERRKSQSKMRDSVMFNSLARFDKSGSQRSEEMFTSDSKQEPGESESKSERGDWSLGTVEQCKREWFKDARRNREMDDM